MKRTHPDIVEFIQDRAGWTPTQIRAAIEDDPVLRSETPSLRTVQRIATAVPPAAAATESLTGVDAADMALALPVLAAGRNPLPGSLTASLVRAIAWLRRAAPDIPLGEAYRLGRRLYTDDDFNERLLPYLAFAPWRDDATAYLAAYAGRRFRRIEMSEYTIPAYKRWANEKRAASRSQPPADVQVVPLDLLQEGDPERILAWKRSQPR